MINTANAPGYSTSVSFVALSGCFDRKTLVCITADQGETNKNNL